jgi:nucleoside-diphosphate-sugar epimerase
MIEGDGESWMSRQRLAVTGASGFIGTTVCRHLVDAGHDVVAIDKLPPQDPDQRVTTVVGELQSPRGARLAAGCDTVIHLAGLPGVVQSWSAQEAYWAENVTATHALLDAFTALKSPPRLVFFSSSSVYPASDVPAAEGDTVGPRSPYGVTKLAAETLALNFAALHGLQVTVVRPFTVYGERQRPEMAVARLVAAALDGQPFRSHGPPTDILRDWTYVGDLASFVAQLVALPSERWPPVVNVASGSFVPLTTVAVHLQGLTGVETSWEVVRPRALRHVAADISLLRSLVPDFRPTPLAVGLARQLASARASSAGC